MKQDKLLRTLRGLMLAINLVLVVYYSLIRALTPLRVAAGFAARDFLSQAGMVPAPPWQMAVLSMGVFIPLAVLMLGKDWLPLDRPALRAGVFAAEILLAAAEVITLDFYYRALFLMVLADLVSTVQERYGRVCIIAVLTLLYALSDYDIASAVFPSVPLRQYLSYYTDGFHSWFSGVESLLTSLHVLLFVIFLVLLFLGQKEENTRVHQLNAQLQESYRQLQEYADKTEHMAELRERNRLAREIHDTLGHTLTGIIMTTDASLVLMDAAPDQAKKQLELANRTARDGLNDVRRSINALRPDALEHSDFAEALENTIEKFCLTTSAKVTYTQNAGELDFAPDEEEAIYRVIQESLTNAVRHGQARNIEVRLDRDGDELTITVRDDGTGMPSGKKEGFGLRHMRERLELLHGSLQYGNRPAAQGSGFELTARLRPRQKGEENI